MREEAGTTTFKLKVSVYLRMFDCNLLSEDQMLNRGSTVSPLPIVAGWLTTLQLCLLCSKFLCILYHAVVSVFSFFFFYMQTKQKVRVQPGPVQFDSHKLVGHSLTLSLKGVSMEAKNFTSFDTLSAKVQGCEVLECAHNMKEGGNTASRLVVKLVADSTVENASFSKSGVASLNVTRHNSTRQLVGEHGTVSIERHDCDICAEMRFGTVEVGWDMGFLPRWANVSQACRLEDNNNGGESRGITTTKSSHRKPKVHERTTSVEKQQWSKIKVGIQVSKLVWNFEFHFDNLDDDARRQFLDGTGTPYRNENVRVEIVDIEMSSACLPSNTGESPIGDSSSTLGQKLDVWTVEFKEANAFLCTSATNTHVDMNSAKLCKPFARIRLLKHQASHCVIKLQNENQQEVDRNTPRILQDPNGVFHLERVGGTGRKNVQDGYKFEKCPSSEQETQSSAESAREEMLLAEKELTAERSSAVSVRLLLPHVTVDVDEKEYCVALHVFLLATKTKQTTGQSCDNLRLPNKNIVKMSGPSLFVSLEIDESELLLREIDRSCNGAASHTSVSENKGAPLPTTAAATGQLFVLAMERAKLCHFYGFEDGQKHTHTRFACKDFTLYECDKVEQNQETDETCEDKSLVPILFLTKWGTNLDFVLPENRYALSILYKIGDGVRDISVSLHCLTLRYRVFSDWFLRIKNMLTGSRRSKSEGLAFFLLLTLLFMFLFLYHCPFASSSLLHIGSMLY